MINDPRLKNGQKNCHNCKHGQFVGGGDDYRCDRHLLIFDNTTEASGCVCNNWESCSLDKNQSETTIIARSGNVTSHSQLAIFLYILIRDYLPAGTIEKILREHKGIQTAEFSNGWLATYAEDVANRLTRNAN